MTNSDGLLDGMHEDAVALGKDPTEVAQIARAGTLYTKTQPVAEPAPEPDEPRHVGELPVAESPGYGRGHRFRNAWTRMTEQETA